MDVKTNQNKATPQPFPDTYLQTNTDEPSERESDHCRDFGGRLYSSGGCLYCPHCGWSRCS